MFFFPRKNNILCTPIFSPKHVSLWMDVTLHLVSHTLNNQYRIDTSLLNAPLCLYIENNLKVYGVREEISK